MRGKISLLIIAVLPLFMGASLFASEELKLLLYTPPKTGTHLVGKLVTAITGMEGEYQLCEVGSTKKGVKLAETATANGRFAIAHNWTRKILSKLEKKGYKILFTLRDPRDQTISMQEWFLEGQWSWMGASKIKDREKQLEEMITGDLFGWSSPSMIFERYLNIAPLSPSICKVVKFEELIGREGGGSREEQLRIIAEIAEFLGVKLSDGEVEAIASQLFGNSATFRRGKIGAWRGFFTENHKRLFKVRYQHFLEHFGYERDLNW